MFGATLLLLRLCNTFLFVLQPCYSLDLSYRCISLLNPRRLILTRWHIWHMQLCYMPTVCISWDWCRWHTCVRVKDN